MTQKAKTDTVVVRIRLTEEILAAMDALRQINGQVDLKTSQIFQAITARGAKALLADVEFGANLQLSEVKED